MVSPKHGMQSGRHAIIFWRILQERWMTSIYLAKSQSRLLKKKVDKLTHPIRLLSQLIRKSPFWSPILDGIFSFVRNRFGEPHLWSKQSSLSSPTRQKSTPSTPKVNAESMFLSKNKEENESLVSTLSERAIQVLSNMVFSMFNKIKSPFC